MGIFGRPKLLKKKKKDVPDDLWKSCKHCQKMSHILDLKQNQYVCPHCDYHAPLSAHERIQFLADENSFEETNKDMRSSNPLSFPKYEEKITAQIKKTNINDAIVTGKLMINHHKAMIAVMDFNFFAGSMGSVVGEKITRTIEQAIKEKLPVIIISSSSGARMQEGMFSLMQMAKTCGALAGLNEAKLPYISVMAHPTTGGVTASFATIGDINLSEPKTMIGFAGPRVIKETTHQDLPEGFQTAEFMLEHGLLDDIVHRHQLRNKLASLLFYLTKSKK